MKHNVDDYGCLLCHKHHFLSDRGLEFSSAKIVKMK